MDEPPGPQAGEQHGGGEPSDDPAGSSHGEHGRRDHIPQPDRIAEYGEQGRRAGVAGDGGGGGDMGEGGVGALGGHGDWRAHALRGNPDRRAALLAMPKAELHLHLDGSLRIDTAIDLARSRGIDAPLDVAGMRAALGAPMPCRNQAELLRAFDLPIALMQDAEALERITTELIETKAAENVRYLEIRWGPLLHVARGLSLPDGIAAVTRGARDAAARTGTEVRLICTAIRSHEPAANLELAEAAVRSGDGMLTGWDLAGDEERFPDPKIHAAAFAVARAGGLRITLHAGEWDGAAQVRQALELDPERIAHGPVAIDDRALCAELIARGVTLDLCPTSNWQAGVVPSIASHPLARLHRLGVRVTLSTDDMTVSDLSLTDEYERSIDQIGLTIEELWAIDRHALAVAFADTPTRDRLRSEFDAWAERAGLSRSG